MKMTKITYLKLPTLIALLILSCSAFAIDLAPWAAKKGVSVDDIPILGITKTNYIDINTPVFQVHPHESGIYLELNADLPQPEETNLKNFLLAHFNNYDFPNISNYLTFQGDEFAFQSYKPVLDDMRQKSFVLIKGYVNLKELKYDFKKKGYVISGFNPVSNLASRYYAATKLNIALAKPTVIDLIQPSGSALAPIEPDAASQLKSSVEQMRGGTVGVECLMKIGKARQKKITYYTCGEAVRDNLLCKSISKKSGIVKTLPLTFEMCSLDGSR